MALELWNVDPAHSSVTFTVRHMVVSKVRGRFGKWTAILGLDAADLSKSTVEVSIEAASIDTGVGDRDAHLKSPDFFDAAKFPALGFKSKKVAVKSGTALEVTGDLTMHGVSKEIVLAVEHGPLGKDPWGNQRSGFSAHAAINRKDWGLGWNQVLEAGGLLVSEKVEIELELQAIKPAAKPA